MNNSIRPATVKRISRVQDYLSYGPGGAVQEARWTNTPGDKGDTRWVVKEERGERVKQK